MKKWVVLSVTSSGRSPGGFPCNPTRRNQQTPPPVEVQQGLHAYALRQAHVYETLRISFVNQWRKLLMLYRLGSSWLCHYPIATNPLSTKPSCGHSRSGLKPVPTPTGDPPNKILPLHLQHLYQVLTVTLTCLWRMVRGVMMTATILLMLGNVILTTD